MPELVGVLQHPEHPPGYTTDVLDYFGERQSQFEVFWQKAKEFLEDVGTAVDDRTHSTVIYVAKAISVRDLCEKVVERCPPDTPIPSDEWICLQFSPVCVTLHGTFSPTCTSRTFTERYTKQVDNNKCISYNREKQA